MARRRNGNERLRRLLAGILLAAVLILASLPVAGVDRSLFWQDLTVRARLDNDGRLHVRETHTMVFTGDWNGGERIFAVRPGQSLQLNGLYRLDATGTLVPLTKGSLDRVDRYNWQGDRQLRWRSRLPGDPPFNGQHLTYLIDYTLSGVIMAAGDRRFLLNHDYAFPDRSGQIVAFSLELNADDGWEQEALPLLLNRRDLAPGQSVIVRTELRYRTGTPTAVFRPATSSRPDADTVAPAPAWLRFGSTLFLLLLLAGATRSFLRHESARGRFTPLPDQTKIDKAWLERHVFHLLPETVGAAWDKSTANAEVAAILARLVLANKLNSRLEPVRLPLLGWRIPGQNTLHLTLLQPRSTLHGYERSLIDALFISGDQTDSRQIRAHYRQRGHSFKPVETIRDRLEQRVKRLTQSSKDQVGYRWLLPLAALLSALLLLLVNGIIHRNELDTTVIGTVAGVGTLIIGLATATAYRHRSDRLPRRALLLIATLLLPPVVFLLLGRQPISGLLTVGLTLLYGGLIDMVLLLARNRDSRDGIELCRNLAAARLYFERQLRTTAPALRDEWFPYLVAFGLAPEVDRWVRSFSASASSTVSSADRAMPSATGFSGGGGRFGGAGASGSWAAAATALGSASSSSSGGGSGGGSSGGGGGGGW